VNDPLGRVLKLVAEGRLTAEEAAPILDALSDRPSGPSGPASTGAGPAPRTTGSVGASEADGTTVRTGATFARIEVREGGRRVVDLRIPTSLGRFALGRVPGLSTEQVSELQSAISSGVLGPLLEVEDDDGDGVRIVLE